MIKFFSSLKSIVTDLQLILNILNELLSHHSTVNPELKAQLVKRLSK